jgi:hypothetical protein
MPHFNPFDMDFDGDVDGIDFLGFEYLMRRVLPREEYWRDDGGRNAFRNLDEWCDDDELEN